MKYRPCPTEPRPCCLNCTSCDKYKEGCFIFTKCDALQQGLLPREAINGPMPCEGEHYVGKDIYPSTIRWVIRKSYGREKV